MDNWHLKLVSKRNEFLVTIINLTKIVLMSTDFDTKNWFTIETEISTEHTVASYIDKLFSTLKLFSVEI